VERATGVLLVVTGVLFLTGTIQTMGYWLLEAFPALGSWARRAYALAPTRALEWGMGETIFYEIAALLLAAAVIGLLGTALRQPVVVSFIAVGIIAATLFQPSPHTVEQIDFFAELGVTLLLFLVGLKLDWRLVRALGPVALATGLGQVGFTSGFGFLICLGSASTP
jgi:hypothetical protein